MCGNTQLLGEDLTVSACLVEHIHEVGIFKDIFHLAAAQKVFDILGDTCRNTAPFSESLPDFHRIGGGLLLLQKQVHLVDVVTGGLVGGTVDGNAVPHLILYHQHTDFFKLLAQFLDVIADNPVINVHIALMIEHIQRTRYIDFQCRCNVLSFFFFLLPQQVIKVLQNRHILRLWVIEIFVVNQPYTTVNNGFLHRLQALLTAHDQLTQAEDKVRLE